MNGRGWNPTPRKSRTTSKGERSPGLGGGIGRQTLRPRRSDSLEGVTLRGTAGGGRTDTHGFMNDTTVTVDGRIARNLTNAATDGITGAPEVAQEIRRSAEEIRRTADGFGETEVPAYELTWLVAEAERSDQVTKAAVTEATDALVEAGVWER